MPAPARLTAVLGPTNTGKTYLAVERMLGHATGMIGFPLRLLARENYDRIVAAKGARLVALVTGEEKIVPPNARWLVCTVESMPLDRQVDFLAVDEVQMAADPERGHVFTDRILHARGTHETMLLGADTARPLLRRLVPEIEFVARPRFSSLGYTGPRKVTRLPPRTAVVAFSAAEVYRLAELVRRQRGGTAVVLGALSPRARNAQVGMYQAGEVDYLVATDAIGMGLNMDVRHVAFSSLTKFDGRRPRRLTAAEIGQIAGRAGRHTSDGTFGTTDELGAMDEELVSRLEEHQFDPIETFQWRTRDLDFRSVAALERSLDAPPPLPGLVRTRPAEDEEHLAQLTLDAEVRALATARDRVMLLWEVCQVPDFRKTMTDLHARLLGRIYGYLVRGEGRLPEDWVAAQVAHLDRTDGDIDALMARIAGTRTWTYISHRAGWLADAGHWQERALAIEDKLSDALHARLTQRFVDRRTAVLMQRMRDGGELIGGVTAGGEVVVEGEFVGRLEGFRFVADRTPRGMDARPLFTAAQRVLKGEIGGRIGRLAASGDEDFHLDGEGRVTWQGQPIARLAAGRHVLRPRVDPYDSDLLDGDKRRRIRERAEAWMARHVGRTLAPLDRLAVAARGGALSGPARGSALSGPARGLAFRLVEAFGMVPRRTVADLAQTLARDDRRALSELGVRFGRETIYLPAAKRGRAPWLMSLLWRVHAGRLDDERLPEPADGPMRGPLAVVDGVPPAYYATLGLRAVGRHALCPDRLERLVNAAHGCARQGPFRASAELAGLVGLEVGELAPVLRAVGFRERPSEEGPVFVSRPARRRPRRRAATNENSPFAPLKALVEPA